MEIDDSIYYVLKSIYRYTQLKNMKEMAPDILLENEERLMKARLLELSCDEIVAMVNVWPDFLKEHILEDAKQNKELDEDLAAFFKQMN